MSTSLSGKRKNSAVGGGPAEDLLTPPASSSSTVEDLLVHDDFDLDLELDLEEADDLVTELMGPSNNAANSSNRERSSSTSDNDLLDYDSVSSPGGSSTASGPTYIRQAGFEQHAHEVKVAPPSGERVNNNNNNSSSSVEVPAAKDIISSDAGQHHDRRRHLSSTSNASKASTALSRHSFSSTKATPLKGGGPISSSLGATARKKKKNGLLLSADLSLGGKKKIEGVVASSGGGMPTSTRSKSRKEPLPMKQRALPQSFWQQPNVANPHPPGVVCSALPPLPLGGDDAGEMTPVEEVSGSSLFQGANAAVSAAAAAATSINSAANRERDSSVALEGASGTLVGAISKRGERIITAANTDLLFSLFNSVEEAEAQRRIHVVRRGRPKKTPSNSFAAAPRVNRDDDPCLNSTSADSILPLLPERNGSGMSNSSASSSGSASSHHSSHHGSIRGSQGTQVGELY